MEIRGQASQATDLLAALEDRRHQMFHLEGPEGLAVPAMQE